MNPRQKSQVLRGLRQGFVNDDMRIIEVEDTTQSSFLTTRIRLLCRVFRDPDTNEEISLHPFARLFDEEEREEYARLVNENPSHS